MEFWAIWWLLAFVVGLIFLMLLLAAGGSDSQRLE